MGCAVAIVLKVFLNCSDTDQMSFIPHYGVYWESCNSVARFYRNLNSKHVAGEACLDGKARLNDLTVDLIETKLLQFAQALI